MYKYQVVFRTTQVECGARTEAVLFEKESSERVCVYDNMELTTRCFAGDTFFTLDMVIPSGTKEDERPKPEITISELRQMLERFPCDLPVSFNGSGEFSIVREKNEVKIL